MTVNTQYVSFFHSLPLKAERSAMGQDRGGGGRAGEGRGDQSPTPETRAWVGIGMEAMEGGGGERRF